MDYELENSMLHNFLLVDAAQASLLVQDKIEEGVKFINLFSLINGPEQDIPDRYSPLLFYVTQNNFDSLSNMVQSILERNSQQCINIISCSMSYHNLAQHLKNCLIVSDEADKKFLLRFYDTEVLLMLLEILSEIQINSIFHKIDKWQIFSKDSISNLVENSSKEIQESIPMNIVLTSEQLGQLDSYLIRKILTDLQIEDTEDYHELLALAQKASQKYGIEDLDDIELLLEIVYEKKIHKNKKEILEQIIANTSLSTNGKFIEIEKL